MNKSNSFILVCFLLLFSSKSFAQIQSSDSLSVLKINPLPKTKKEINDFTGRGHFFGGLSYIPSFNLSSNLTQEGLLNINKMPARQIGAGLLFEFRRFTYNFQVSRLSFEESKNDFNYRLKGQKIDLALSYRVLGTKEFGLDLGIIASQTDASLQIYSSTNSINLNNLQPSAIQSNNLEINYKPLSLGFTAGLSAREDSKLPMELIFSYQRVMNNAKWTSEYGNVINSPSEKGQNMFSVTGRFYIFSKKRK